MLVATASGCADSGSQPVNTHVIIEDPEPVYFKPGSWQHFLQTLPVKNGLIADYAGNPVSNPGKAFEIIDYDIGKRDLQQCADAIMRLRAEYLFMQKRFSEIEFHFTSGHLFTFLAYCNGSRPVVAGNQVKFIQQGQIIKPSHTALRNYLDIVYAYAGTISLAKELKKANRLSVGTVIIKAGSPGHCAIIIDEAVTSTGEKVYKLAEGYTPAQSIYVLRNIREPEMGAWHTIHEGKEIETASYYFDSYQLGVFE